MQKFITMNSSLHQIISLIVSLLSDRITLYDCTNIHGNSKRKNAISATRSQIVKRSFQEFLTPSRKKKENSKFSLSFSLILSVFPEVVNERRDVGALKESLRK